jgi:cell wall-associated NlpC family hydrolase
MNIDDYIGIPFRHGARGPDAFDCYGLVAAVLLAAKGVSIPDWHADSPHPQGASRAIAAALRGECEGGRAEKVEQPQDFDIAIVGSYSRPHHVGLYVHGGVLHASEFFGSVWHPLPRFKLLYPLMEFYQWRH